MEKKRVGYFDIAKGMGILCVILGHSSIQIAIMLVFTFHMPLFFMISGYFMKKRDIGPLLCDKFRRLIVPYMATCAGLIFLAVLSAVCTGRVQDIGKEILSWSYAAAYGSGNTYTQPFYVKSIGAIWFLPAMFWASILYDVLMDKKWCLLGVTLLALIGYGTVKYVYLPWSIQSAMLALVFVCAGRGLRIKKQFLERPGFLLPCIAFAVWSICLYLDRGRFYLVGNYSENLLLDILGGIAGSYLVLVSAKILEKLPGIGDPLKWFGRYSLIILCFHVVELTFFPWKELWAAAGIERGLLSGCLTLLGKVIWCSLGVCLVLKIPLLAAVFGVEKR